MPNRARSWRKRKNIGCFALVFLNPSVALQRIDGGVAARLCLVSSTPQSPDGDSSPSGEPFGLCNHLPQSCPRKLFPLSHGLRRASSPASGGAFLEQPPRQKLSPFTGKVDTNECEWPKGEWFGGGLRFFLFPLSFAYAQQLPRKRWSLFGATTAQKLSPFTGKVDTSKASGRKGCGSVEPFGLCKHRPPKSLPVSDVAVAPQKPEGVKRDLRLFVLLTRTRFAEPPLKFELLSHISPAVGLFFARKCGMLRTA